MLRIPTRANVEIPERHFIEYKVVAREMYAGGRKSLADIPALQWTLASSREGYFFSPEGSVCPWKPVAISSVGSDSSCSTISWQIRVLLGTIFK